MLAEAGLQWAAPLTVGRERRGLLFFGSKEADARLSEGESRTLRALLGSAAVALRNLDQARGRSRDSPWGPSAVWRPRPS